jgi:hypothetical protein
VWAFQYVAGNDYPIWDTPFGKVGLAMCSEVYMPEVTRALALRGAELIFMPAGLDKRRLWETWRTLLWALVVSTQNLLTAQDRGLSIVTSPESILHESSATAATRSARRKPPAPNRASSPNNGSARSSTTLSTRANCPKRRSDPSNLVTLERFYSQT